MPVPVKHQVQTAFLNTKIFIMKKRSIVTACIFALAITGVVATQASARFAVYYTDSFTPGFCLSGQSLPSGCTAVNTGILCQANGTQYTFYQNVSCTAPWYRMP